MKSLETNHPTRSRSKEASEKLVKLGYTNIMEFGGILDWTGEVLSED
jgi:rhodanese-related sulfurtransferase